MITAFVCHDYGLRSTLPCCRLLSDAFHDYAVHYSTDASADGSPLVTTADYLATEEAEAVKCQEMFEVVRKYEALHTNTWQVGVTRPRVAYFAGLAVRIPGVDGFAVGMNRVFDMLHHQRSSWPCRVQVLSMEAQSYLARHKQLVQAVLHASGRIGLSDQVGPPEALADGPVPARLPGSGVEEKQQRTLCVGGRA
jgi:hypothetical protein